MYKSNTTDFQCQYDKVLDNTVIMPYDILMTEKDYLMTPQEVSEYLGVTITTVSRHMNSETNPLPSIRISNRVVRVRKFDLDDWLSAMTGTSREFIKNKMEEKEVLANKKREII